MKETVLIVDDNPTNIQLVASVLSDNGLDVEVATSGSDAIETLRERHFDLVLLDIMMPELNGYDTCKKIKENEQHDNTPIIFLTAKTDDESISKGFEVGGVDYLTKPFNADELLARVKTHIQLKKNREILEQTVKKRTAELARANQELEKANRELQTLDDAKNEFINIISHEIRTPLNGILGPLQLMNMENPDGKVSARMRILNESVERLERFSTKMILISELRTNRYKLKYEMVDIHEILTELADEFAQEIAENHLNILISVDKKTNINSDKYLLKRLLRSVFENSVRLSPQKESIKLVSDLDNENCSITIEDQAGSFNPKAIQQVFRPFTPGAKFVDNNMGLGLYLAKLIADTLEAKIEIENIPGGSIVKTIIPQ